MFTIVFTRTSRHTLIVVQVEWLIGIKNFNLGQISIYISKTATKAESLAKMLYCQRQYKRWDWFQYRQYQDKTFDRMGTRLDCILPLMNYNGVFKQHLLIPSVLFGPLFYDKLFTEWSKFTFPQYIVKLEVFPTSLPKRGDKTTI